VPEPNRIAALEKRISVIERRHNDEDMWRKAEEFAKARAYEIAKAEGWI
jgi:hypothetical protein